MEKRRPGRPRLLDPEESRERPQHQVRAFDEEWQLIRSFTQVAKKDPNLARHLLLGGIPEPSNPAAIEKEKESLSCTISQMEKTLDMLRKREAFLSLLLMRGEGQTDNQENHR